MKYSEILARLRKERGFTQPEVADYLSRNCVKPHTNKAVSQWETGITSPPVEQFLVLCELYGVTDIQYTFRGIPSSSFYVSRLNELGKSRVNEYISLLSDNPLFSEPEPNMYSIIRRRTMRLYDIPASAGTGSFLDGGYFEEIEVDSSMPSNADYAITVSGDSMMPRFTDKQIIFIKGQQSVDIGDIGVFYLDGESYVKKFGHGELVSLNPLYEPIKINDHSSFNVFGKVIG
jgi:SOS-response transcriptional repressor LexA